MRRVFELLRIVAGKARAAFTLSAIRAIKGRGVRAIRGAAILRETALYQPVKAFLEGLGFSAKGEVGGCDLVALSGQDPPVVVIAELKSAFTLELVLQAVDRARAGDEI